MILQGFQRLKDINFLIELEKSYNHFSIKLDIVESAILSQSCEKIVSTCETVLFIITIVKSGELLL